MKRNEAIRAAGIIIAAAIAIALINYKTLLSRPEYFIGQAYERGWIVAQDAQKARRWYERAAKIGYNAALIKMARLSIEGPTQSMDDVVAHWREMMGWYKIAAAHKEYEGIYVTTCVDFARGKIHHDNVMVPIRVAAQHGVVPAQYAIAKLAENEDPHTALFWLRRIAELGDDNAQSDLGRMLLKGERAASYPEAHHWLARSVEKRNQAAMVHLAEAYRDGTGVQQDWKQAYLWYHLADLEKKDISDNPRERCHLRATEFQYAEEQKAASHLAKDEILQMDRQSETWRKSHPVTVWECPDPLYGFPAAIYGLCNPDPPVTLTQILRELG